MIDGKAIATAIDATAKRLKPYDSNAMARGLYPVTMRDLVEHRFKDIIGEQDDLPDLVRMNFERLAEPRTQSDPHLIQPVLLNRARPKAPPKIADYRHCNPLMSLFFQWLKKHHPKDLKYADLDHHLSGNKTWPLLKLLDNHTRRLTGMSASGLFFPFAEISGNDDCDWDWDSAWVPLFDRNSWMDEIPLIEFLEMIKNMTEGGDDDDIEWPEVVFSDGVILPSSRIRQGNIQQIAQRGKIALIELLRRQKVHLLRKQWKTAITALKQWPYGRIAFEDPEETRCELRTLKDLEFAFKGAAQTISMRKAIVPLIQELYKNVNKFWGRIMEDLNVIADQNPKWLKTTNNRISRPSAANRRH